MGEAHDHAPTVGQVLGAAGACPEVEYAGRVWRVGFPTQRAKARLEELFAAQALAEVKALEGVLDPADYAGELAAVRDAVRSKQYRTWAPGWVAAMNGPEAGTLFLLSLLRENHPDATAADARALAENRADEVNAAVDRVAAPFFETVAADFPGTPAAKAKALEVVRGLFSRSRTPTN